MFTELRSRADFISLGSVFTIVAALAFMPIALAAQSDATPPTVSLTAPAANATVSGTVTVSATAADNVGVAGVQFRLDGAPLSAEDLSAPYSISWNTLGSPATDLVFGVTKVIVGPMTMTAGTGFTKRLSATCPGCTGEDMVSEDKIQTVAGATAATWTFSMPGRYLAQMAAFKAAGAPAYVQGAVAASNSASTSIARAFTSNVTAGHLLVVAVAWQGNSAVSATDSLGNVYAVATSAYDATNGQSLAILYAANAVSGATTVTASFGGTTPAVQRMEIHAYSGMATANPLDVTAMNSADGTTAANTITSGSATTTGMAAVSDGAHTLTAQARDAAGNTTTSAVVPVTVNNAGGDVTSPVVSISAPGAGTTATGSVTVSANASDNVGVSGVQFRLDGAPLNAEDMAAPYSISWNTLGSPATDLVFGVTKVIVGPMTMTAGTGFTKRLSAGCPGCTGEDMVSEDKVQTVAGATAATWTFSMPGRYLAQMAAFKAAGTPAYVQGAAAGSNSGSTTIAKAFASNVTAGHLLVVAVAWQGNSVVSVADNRGNAYAVATTAYDATNGQGLAILYAANAASGATTVTASFGGASPTVKRMEIHAYSGMATANPLDVTAKNTADGTTAANTITSGSATTSGTAPVSNGPHTLTALARDAAGNTTTSAAVTVTVNNAGGGDTTPPVISGVAAASITSTGATINWTTNEASDSQADYGTTTAYGSSSALNGSQVTAHAVSLSGLAGGALYHYRVRSRDAAGNLALSGDFTFTTLAGADTAPPTVSVTAPAANATVSGTVTVNAAAADNVGVIGVQFRLDGAPLGAEDVAAPYSTSWNTTAATNTSHILTAVARDAATNQTTSTAVSVTVANDTVPPAISAVASSSITSSGATINWTTNEASDSQADYGTTTAYGSSSALNASLVTAHAVSLNGLAGGALYHYRVRSRDAAGNLALSGDFTFTTLAGADTAPPTVSVTAPAANATVSGTVTVNATAADNVGVSGVQFRLDGAPLSAEDVAAPYSISWNTLGSPATDLIFGVTKVMVGPMTMTAGSGFTKRLGVSCSGCSGEDMSTEDKIQTVPGPTAATFTFSMAARYLSQMAAFKAAGTPAYVQGAVATSNTASTTVARAFGANVAAGNLLVVAVAWQGNSGVSATDTRGNLYAVATSAYDSVNGQSLAILYAANAISGATTVTVSFGGTTPAVQRLEIHAYSGMVTVNPLDVTRTNIADGTTAANTITSGSATTTGLAPVSNGAHTLTAQARDAAGNTTTSTVVTVTVNNTGDTTPPAISGVAAASITSSGATINWTTNEASDSQVDYGATTAYGSASPLNGSFVTTHSVILGALAGNTTYHVRARSRDAAGNLALSGDVVFTTLTVDATPPVVSITAPAANATVSGTTTFSATATDNVGVAGVEFKRDGVLISPEDTVAPYTVAWNTTTTTNATHTLTAVAWDAAGNSATAIRTVTVANALGQVVLAWNANTEPDLSGYRVYVGTSSGVYSSNFNAGNTTGYTVTGLTPGAVYYLAVTAYDQTGFESGTSNEVSAAK